MPENFPINDIKTKSENWENKADTQFFFSVLDCAKNSNSEVWVCGGWGIDGLVGRATRLHKDVDLVVQTEDLANFLEELVKNGFVEYENKSGYKHTYRKNGLEVEIVSSDIFIKILQNHGCSEAKSFLPKLPNLKVGEKAFRGLSAENHLIFREIQQTRGKTLNWKKTPEVLAKKAHDEEILKKAFNR
jgi:hypothetical protein